MNKLFYNTRLKLGSDQNLRDKYRKNPDLLVHCCQHQLESVANRLIRLEPTACLQTNTDRQTPLMIAVKSGLWSIVDLILKVENVDINAVDINGNSAFIYLIMSVTGTNSQIQTLPYLDIITKLLPANLHHTNFDSNTVLILAIMRRHAVRSLLQSQQLTIIINTIIKSDPTTLNFQDKYGNNCLLLSFIYMDPYETNYIGLPWFNLERINHCNYEGYNLLLRCTYQLYCDYCEMHISFNLDNYKMIMNRILKIINHILKINGCLTHQVDKYHNNLTAVGYLIKSEQESLALKLIQMQSDHYYDDYLNMAVNHELWRVVALLSNPTTVICAKKTKLKQREKEEKEEHDRYNSMSIV